MCCDDTHASFKSPSGRYVWSYQTHALSNYLHSRRSLFRIHTRIPPSMGSINIYDWYSVDTRLLQWTLTLLSVWWALGQLVASLISWGFIVNYSCSPSIAFGECPRSQNMGWRYTL